MNGETPSRLKAPELRVAHWLDGNGQPRTPLTLADLGTRYIMLYCFQHWCPGCHSTGFPTLKKVITALSTKEFGVAVVQTVFEGEEVNTPERLRETQLRYDLHVPFGHDAAVDGYPSVMHDYRTGGTPWFIVINPTGEVIYGGFSLDAEAFIASVEHARAPTN